ncbi:PepSY domain-containing protein [Pseudomonas mangrovi]|uniref:Peptidase n=1 Tax=Pseudomonas mangrovi TaxID=2161748 RepID=A0A2T5P829_9PSED|nr:PepSY domain-containing protein [Pseudomonas mangrovi]PTU73845.1 peptidase [Pseudomonas mangrovi]
MNNFTKIIGVATIALSVSGLAQARDIGPDEVLRLREANTIKNLEELNKSAVAKHAGAVIEESELEEEYGRYIYQLELRDAQGVKWDLEFDAATGEMLRNQQDD